MRGRFGKIDYLNLLPFDFYIKKSKYNYLKRSLKRSHPAKITELFLRRKVDAAFISSISSRGKKCLDAGIVADGEVLSVFVCKGEDIEDSESKSSNTLKKIVGLKGEVVIGNKALQLYHNRQKECKDLALSWREQTGLPFVFALFCINSNGKFYKKVVKGFLKQKIKIPQYIKKQEAVKLKLPIELVEIYLKKIGYKIENREKKAVKLFLKKEKELRIKKWQE